MKPHEKNMDLIHSYDPYGNPPDEYYEERAVICDQYRIRSRKPARRFSSDYDDNDYEYSRFGANR